MLYKLLFFVMSLALAIGSTPDVGLEDRAKLLVNKRLQNMYLVEGSDIVVHYSLFNIGTAPALKVQLRDAGFSTNDFDVVAGQLSVQFDRIPPSSNVSHTVVVRPKNSGYYNFTSAVVEYFPSEDATTPQVGYSSEPGQGGIVPLKEFDRRFSPHLFEWVIFALLLVPVLVIPYLMWRKISTKYTISSKKSK